MLRPTGNGRGTSDAASREARREAALRRHPSNLSSGESGAFAPEGNVFRCDLQATLDAFFSGLVPVREGEAAPAAVAAQLHDGMQQHALDGRREDLRHAPELGMDESSINITQLDVDRGALVRHPVDRGVMHVWRTDVPEERIRHARKVS